jgi:hypothetical protein
MTTRGHVITIQRKGLSVYGRDNARRDVTRKGWIFGAKKGMDFVPEYNNTRF